tara:strand:+ start:920 stop:1153 length:234 start_codon:yes stop_codon:yes gene_type:complete
MSWLSLVSGLMKVFGIVGDIVRNRQLMGAGAAKQREASRNEGDKQSKQGRIKASKVRSVLRGIASDSKRLRDKWSRD